MKKLLPIFIAAVLVASGGSFYGGMKYAQNKTLGGLSQADSSGRGESAFDRQNLRNLSPKERQQKVQEFGINMDSGFRGGRSGEGFVNGEIIAKDEKSVTVKLRDGGSKIVFYSDSTEIGKFVSGTLGDLETGKTITVNGKTNSDGSITAESIQLRLKISP